MTAQARRMTTGFGTALLLATVLCSTSLGQVPRRTEITVTGCVQREADYLRAGGIGAPDPDARQDAQFVLLDAAGVALSLNGTRERELQSRVGERVEVTGTLEEPSPGLPLEREAGVTPAGGAAHEPGNATSSARVQELIASAPRLQRLNIGSFRPADGKCAPLPTTTSQRPSDAPAASNPVPAGRGATTQELARVQGCIARDPESSERLMLMKATVVRGAASTTAVPGSFPSGSGSGTTSPNQAQRREGEALSFYLDAQAATLAKHIGSRVEVVGAIVQETGPATASTGARGGATAEGSRLPAPAPSVSHPSAALRRIAVTAVRAIGGACQ